MAFAKGDTKIATSFWSCQNLRQCQIIMKKITLLLVDDHRIVRQGLRALVSEAEDMEVVGEAENGSEAVQVAIKTAPDVVVMDVVMPVTNGLEATRQIMKKAPSSKVLVLSSYSDEDYVRQLTEAGALGYVVKQTAAEDLLLAIREVQKGRAFFSASIAKRARDRDRQAFNDGRASAQSRALTARETQVLQLISEGAGEQGNGCGIGE